MKDMKGYRKFMHIFGNKKYNIRILIKLKLIGCFVIFKDS